jgi:hypothetical protein
MVCRCAPASRRWVADRANDEERGHAAVPVERLGRAPRHGSSQSLIWGKNALAESCSSGMF